MDWTNVRRFQLLTAVLYAVATSLNVFELRMSNEFLTDEGAQAYHFVVCFLLIAWLMGDPKIPAAKRPSLDFGLFLWMTFPFLAAWLLISTRGWRGSLILFGLLTLMFAPQITWVLAASTNSNP
ncbi:MAG: hypothetical protein H7Y89_15520 [Steroidobacteraceae bacterium]|nr:hypothetical protein [Steroidobacteraceae bacterium]